MTSKDSNSNGTPQPLLASSNSQKNIQMIKALQQLNHQMMYSQQNSNSLSQLSLMTSPSQHQLNNLKSSVISQSSTAATKLSQHQPQHFTQSQLSLLKQSKPLTQNLTNIPLSTKSSANVTTANAMNNIQQAYQKPKQHQQKGVLLQRCESHQSILQGSTPMNNSKFKINNENSSLSPQTQKHSGLISQAPNVNVCYTGQKSNKHSRQQSSIVNFNQCKNGQISQQKSLSPSHQQYSIGKNKQLISVRPQINERVKSLDNDEVISKVCSGSSYDVSSQNERAAQLIRISPNKQFIVHPCTTQHTSPKELFKQSAFKLQNKIPKTGNNLILEQEDYLLPSAVNNQISDDVILEDYSLNKDFQTLIHHDHNMTKQTAACNGGTIKYSKESDQSINQGFITDRQQSSKNESQTEPLDKKQRKTKGSSYTRNAQELKKLLLETGVLGGAVCLTTSLATAAVGIAGNNQTQDQVQDEVKSCHKTTTAKVKKNEVFCFSARNKNSKQIVDQKKEAANKQMCLLESNMQIKKQQTQKNQQQLESSIQTQQPTKNVFYQTLDQNINIPTFPASTTNQINLKEFILKEDSENDFKNSNHHQNLKALLDDPNTYNPYSQLDPNFIPTQLSRRSPSSCLSMREDSNFPLYETDQFIVRKDMIRNYNLPTQPSYQNPSFAESTHQRVLNRCWTAQDDINNLASKKVLPESASEDSTSELPQKSNSNKAKIQTSLKNTVILKSSQKRLSGVSQPKNHCFDYNNKQMSPRSNENVSSNIQKDQSSIQSKELEILKFKMIAFVKTYENQFRKMKLEMNELKTENRLLKSKLNQQQKRRSSAVNTNAHTSLSKVASTNNNPTVCFTSAHNSQMIM